MTEVQAELARLAASANVGVVVGPFSLAAMENPEWESARRVHDWRNHVPDGIRDLWGRLPLDAKLVAFIGASLEAEEEEWE